MNLPPHLATPPRSPTKKRFSNSSPSKLIPASISWRKLELKLAEVIGKNNMNSSPPPLPPPPISSQNYPIVTIPSRTTLVDIDSSFFRQSSSSSSLYLNSDELNNNNNKPKSPKPHSKLKTAYLRLRSNSSSTSSTNSNPSNHTPPSSASKRSQSSSRNTSPTIRSAPSTTQISNSPSPIIKHSSSFSDYRPTTTTTAQSTTTASTSSPSTSPKLGGPSKSNNIKLGTSPTLPPSPPLSIPRLKKAQSLIQLSSAWFRKLDSIPPPPLPIPAPQFNIQFTGSNKNSPPMPSTSTRSSTPTLISTPTLPSSSTFTSNSTSTSTSNSIATPPPPILTIPNPTPFIPNVALDLLLSLSNRFRTTSGESEEIITDEELSSWRKEDKLGGGGGISTIGERINLMNRYEDDEEHIDLDTLEDSNSTSSISTSVASSIHMFRNISQSPSLPSPVPISPFSQSINMNRSTSTSSLPNSPGMLLVPQKTLVRKLSFTPISIPAMKAPRRRLELVETFPLPPIRL